MKKNYSVRKLIALIIGFTMLLGSAMCVMAGDAAIVETSTGETEIAVFVKGIDSVPENISVQIGTTVSDQVSCQKVEEIGMQTLILLDNSLSIPSAVRPKITELLQDIIGGRASNEQIAIGVFDEEINYLTEYTTDYATLKNTVDHIEYENQETYLTDVLYDLLSKEYADNSSSIFRRIIILSDGVDNKSLGYTKEELYSLMKEMPYPIYTIGCQTGNNNEQLENMFALSRMSKAESFLLNESETLSITDRLSQDKNIIKVNITPPAEMLDGSRKAVKINFAGAEVSCEIKMPQKVEEITEEETSEVEPSSTEEVIPETEEIEETEPETVEEEIEDGKSSTYRVIFIGIIVCMIIVFIAVIVLLIVMIVKKQNQQKEQTRKLKEEREKQLNEVLDTESSNQDEKTQIVGMEKPRTDSETFLMWDNTTRYITLTDIHVPAKSFQVPFQGSIIIGRKKEFCQLVLDYDMSVSSKHCEVMMRNNKIYIRDLQSSNGTYVNGAKVLVDTEIVSGCQITLGRLEMRLEIR